MFIWNEVQHVTKKVTTIALNNHLGFHLLRIAKESKCPAMQKVRTPTPTTPPKPPPHKTHKTQMHTYTKPPIAHQTPNFI